MNLKNRNYINDKMQTKENIGNIKSRYNVNDLNIKLVLINQYLMKIHVRNIPKEGT